MSAGTRSTGAGLVLEITVENHPGVMVQVCSLFARRAYNMEAILCTPVGDGSESRIWILVNEEQRLDQVERQLMKLEDVRDVRRQHETFADCANAWLSSLPTSD